VAAIEELGENVEEMASKLQLGAGAQFWAYISGQNETPKRVTSWEVRFEQEGGNWVGTITSDNPHEILQTPELSGLFRVKVKAWGPEFGPTELTPLPDSKPNIGCNVNCASFVGIVASPDALGANYWTVWDAICSKG
jgi:hypothetical protein